MGRGSNRPDVTTEEIVRLYRSGLTVFQVAARLGISHYTVCARMEQRGIRRRTKAENAALRKRRLKKDAATADARIVRMRKTTKPKQDSEPADLNKPYRTRGKLLPPEELERLRRMVGLIY